MSRPIARVVLETRRLRWSTPGTLNDPFDNQFGLPVNVDRQRLRRTILQCQWEAYAAEVAAPVANEVGRMLQRLRARAPGLTRAQFDEALGPGVEEGLERGERRLLQLQRELRMHVARNKLLCLSQRPDSNLMWAHYAEGHQGLVLRFRCAPGIDSPWPAGRGVNYVREMPRLFDDQMLIELMAGRANLDPLAMLSRLVFSKSIEWAYEVEWRIHPACLDIRNVAREAVAQHGPDAWLFPSLPAKKLGRARWFQDYGSRFLRQRVGITDRRYTMHSFRHLWRTLARECEMPESVSRAIMGHSLGTGEHGAYGGAPSLKLRAEWVANIDPLANN